MKKIVLLFLLLLTISLSAFTIGNPVGDLSWTDNNGEYHSIHELIDNGRVVLFFWGENW
ncbi:MAG: hypothetical protein K9N06_10405 [Candidatus Cloacimonetes bacterium]|nr:hypothetical protein [Candidatus Cloacimonadota bacterium]